MTYVVAFYEVALAFGGPEEGGWHYTTGELARVVRVCRSEERAGRLAQRANVLLNLLQRHRRPVGSVLYDGGRYRACVFERTAPTSFPETRPHYE